MVGKALLSPRLSLTWPLDQTNDASQELRRRIPTNLATRPRDFAILQLFLQTGIRVRELVSLTWDDLDLENRALVVRQGKGKKDRTIPLARIPQMEKR
jgi:integrase